MNVGNDDVLGFYEVGVDIRNGPDLRFSGDSGSPSAPGTQMWVIGLFDYDRAGR